MGWRIVIWTSAWTASARSTTSRPAAGLTYSISSRGTYLKPRFGINRRVGGDSLMTSVKKSTTICRNNVLLSLDICTICISSFSSPRKHAFRRQYIYQFLNFRETSERYSSSIHDQTLCTTLNDTAEDIRLLLPVIFILIYRAVIRSSCPVRV